ncbi:MAG: flagellar biosynthesis anti-sigma factor FlgM [Acidobacteriia bacterium]|nr:flagellar biosynthesis anti-sigma factor FlgM [Terriglobia bacterium]
MRVYDRNLTGGPAAESGRAQETQKLDRDAGARAASPGADGSGDRVELSSSLARLSRMISGYGSERSSRVQSLAAQYQSGSYRPDSLAISRGMIAEALSAGSK